MFQSVERMKSNVQKGSKTETDRQGQIDKGKGESKITIGDHESR